MEEQEIIQAYDLLYKKKGYINAIQVAEKADNWNSLIFAFERADMSEYLGEFEVVKAAFINEVSKIIDKVDREIEAL